MIIKNYELRIKNWLLILWLGLIPTQLGRHWWPEWSYVNGIRVDYLSPTLYLVDIVWLLWMGSRWLEVLKILKSERKITLAMAGVIVVNVLVATNKWAAIYKWGRLLQLYITAKLITNYKLRITNYLKWILPIWVIVESVLGWGQITKGGALEGVWWWLGERRFSYLTTGIASWEVLGRGMVRAYGTFSHPNSMAGFLLVSLMIWEKIVKKKDWWYWVVFWFGILGIVISGSRVIWLLAIIVNYQLLITNYELKIKKLFGVSLVLGGVIVMILAGINENYRIGDFVGGWDREGLGKRTELNMAAIKMWRDNPLFGVGLNNFLVKLPEYQTSGRFWLQPVHNVPLLILSELGTISVLSIMYYVLRIKQKKLKLNWIWGVILVTMMVDHYWVTLPQNMWLLALVIGIGL